MVNDQIADTRSLAQLREAVMQADYPGLTASLGPVRADLERWVVQSGIDADLAGRAALVLSELATNAIQASPEHHFTVEVDRDGSSLTLAVSNIADAASVYEGLTQVMPEPSAIKGRGLPIVASLCDRIEVIENGEQVTIRGRLI